MEEESLQLPDGAAGFQWRQSANSAFRHNSKNLSPQHLSLQKFATKVGYISSLQTGGKLAPEKAYEQIQSLYTELKQTLMAF